MWKILPENAKEVLWPPHRWILQSPPGDSWYSIGPSGCLRCLSGGWRLDHSSPVALFSFSVLFGWNQSSPSSCLIVWPHGSHGKLKGKVGVRTCCEVRKVLSLNTFLPWKVHTSYDQHFSRDFYIVRPGLTLKEKLWPLLKCLVSPLRLTYFLFEMIKKASWQNWPPFLIFWI